MPARFGSFLGLGLLAATGPAWAGAWTMEQGHGQVIIGGLLSQADASFDGSRSTTTTPRYNKFEAEALLEYGLTNRFTLMLGPGIQHIDIAAPIDAARTGLGYTEFGARYRIWQNDSWVFSGQVLTRAPGTDQTTNPAAIGYTDPEVDTRALLGHSFSFAGLPAFIDLEAAQRFRFGDPPDEFRFDATFGVHVAPNWLLMAQSLNVFSEGAGTGIYFPAYDYEKLQLSAVYTLTPSWAVQFGGFTAYSGRNALQENGLIAALWYNF